MSWKECKCPSHLAQEPTVVEAEVVNPPDPVIQVKPPLPPITVLEWIKLVLFSDIRVVPSLIQDRLEMLDNWIQDFKFPRVELPWVFAGFFLGLFGAWITIGTTLDRVEKRFLFNTPVEVQDSKGRIWMAQGEVYMQQKAFEEITKRANDGK